MRITTRLGIISTASILALAVLASALTWSFIEFSSAKDDYVLADSIKIAFLERASSRDQYFLYRENRARTQWEANQEIAGRLLHQAEVQFKREDEQAVLERLRQNSDDSQLIFERIVRNTEALRTALNNRPVYEELDKRLFSQLLLRATAIRDEASILQDMSAKRVEQAYEHLITIVILFALTLALATLLTSLLLVRLVRQRLALLHQGARTVADGDLAYRITCEGNDEFAELALSINAMTDSLQASHKELEAEVRSHQESENELRIAAVAFASQNGMMITDTRGVILRINPAFTRLTGYSAEEAVGQTPALLSSGRHSPLFYQRMWEILKEKKCWQGEMWNKRKNGQVYAELLTITAVLTPDGNISHYVGSFSDITEDKEAEAEIHRLAYYDALTRLPNRRLLQDRLGQAIAATARSGQYGALFFIDLDNFKALNDTRGHDIGDLLLVEVSQRLRAAVREGDTVARQGGDEFVVLLEDLSAEANEAAVLAKQIGEKMRAAIDQPFTLKGHEYHCKISVGIALFHEKDTAEDLFKHADLALYQAKNAGRNTLRFFDPAMQASLELHSALEADLRQALKHDQLRLHFQPQINAARRVVGAEALLRWQHPQRGMVQPNDFIPLAEETGLILPMGLWVLETACAQLKSWEKDARTCSLQLAVNVSARQFRQADFVAQIEAVLTASGVNPAHLKLELTESLVLEDVEDSIGKMLAIKKLGVSFSMDDFGTGYSSLSYLARLPLDQLKIDRSFVRNLPGNRNDETIARTIITMARGLAMDVIAEGVETEAQRQFLEGHGCLAYQGYLFSRPLPLEEFEKFVMPLAAQPANA